MLPWWLAQLWCVCLCGRRCVCWCWSWPGWGVLVWAALLPSAGCNENTSHALIESPHRCCCRRPTDENSSPTADRETQGERLQISVMLLIHVIFIISLYTLLVYFLFIEISLNIPQKGAVPVAVWCFLPPLLVSGVSIVFLCLLSDHSLSPCATEQHDPCWYLPQELLQMKIRLVLNKIS